MRRDCFDGIIQFFLKKYIYFLIRSIFLNIILTNMTLVERSDGQEVMSFGRKKDSPSLESTTVGSRNGPLKKFGLLSELWGQGQPWAAGRTIPPASIPFQTSLASKTWRKPSTGFRHLPDLSSWENYPLPPLINHHPISHASTTAGRNAHFFSKQTPLESADPDRHPGQNQYL